MHSTHAPTANATSAPEGPSDVELVAAFCRDFAAERDLPATLNAALEGLVRSLGARSAEGFVWRPESGDFVFQASRGRALPSRPGAERDDPLLGRCLAEGTVLCRPAEGGETAVAYAPLRPEGRPYGVLRLTRERSFDSRDSAMLTAMAGTAALAIANASLAAKLQEQHDTLRDLEFAAEIQRNLLPVVTPGACPVFGLNRPIRQVSGDFFDFFTLPDQRIAFALGDVAGKGMNAALLMAKAASLYRCLGKTIHRPVEILQRLNREIFETASRGMFVTMVAGIYDPAAGFVEFANSGHEPPLLRTPDHSYATFPADAPPLGILPEVTPAAQRVDLTGGEFYIFSDGLTEFRYEQGEQLGVKGLIQMIEALAALPMAERMDTLLSELAQEGWSLRDDLTVLAIDDAWVESHG